MTPALSSLEFDSFRELAREKFGLDLPPGKEQLVAGRLGKNMRALSMNSFKAYYKHVVEDRTGEALLHLIDALTTNHTSFFREPAHFDFLRGVVLPRLRQRARLNVWSAACSSGEEPYTIAFSILDEWAEQGLKTVQILATDISTRVLATAQAAIYPAERFQEIPPERLRRYVLKGQGKQAGCYLVKKHIRSAVEFRRLNLMEQISHCGIFPVIFCRNVMIYFDRDIQENLVRRLASCLEPGGHLFIGHAESLAGLDQPLEYVQPAVYRKPDGSNSRAVKGGVRH